MANAVKYVGMTTDRVIDILREQQRKGCDLKTRMAVDLAVGILKLFKNGNLAEIDCRCEECKYWKFEKSVGVGYCYDRYLHRRRMSASSFCSEGRRKENESALYVSCHYEL